MGSDRKTIRSVCYWLLINRSVTNGDDGIDTEGATSKWFKVDKCVVNQHPGLLNNIALVCITAIQSDVLLHRART